MGCPPAWGLRAGLTTLHHHMSFITISQCSYMCFSLAEDMPGNFTWKHRIMCRNGTKVDFTSNLDDECFLTVVTGGEVCSIFT
jgi:hypothetical protein